MTRFASRIRASDGGTFLYLVVLSVGARARARFVP